MAKLSPRPACERCGATSNIWKTCVGDRCGACGCDAETHGAHVYDYAYNAPRCESFEPILHPGEVCQMPRGHDGYCFQVTKAKGGE